MRYYIADCHFYHRNLITRMDKRNFKDVEEMNEYMIQKWNEKVRKNDEVVILGDFSFGSVEETIDVLKKLNGTKYLIIGNHDTKYLNSKDFDQSLFKWVRPYEELNDNNRFVILSHYPILFYNKQYRKKEDGNDRTYHLCGHVHNSHDDKLLNEFILKERNTLVVEKSGECRTLPCNIINCFCMYSDYTPLTLDEWIEITEKRLEEFEKTEN